MDEDGLFRICVITGPLSEVAGSHVHVYSLIRVLEPLADELFVITRNCPEDIVSNPKVHIRNVKHDSKIQPMLIRIAKQVLWQLRVSFNLIKIRHNFNIVIFYAGSTADLLPALSAKLLRKKIVVIVVGSAAKSAKEIYRETLYGYGGFIFFHILNLLERINYGLADRILAWSQGIVYYVGLERYEYKIRLTDCFFNTDLFKMEKDFNNRRNLIGFIGSLGEAKGVMNFVKAIPLILNRRDDVEFLIGGDGQLREKIEDELQDKKIANMVTITGWILNEHLAGYFNDLRLLVTPSYTEAIPAVAFEGMACGTPVLATPVGGVPDVIKDGENGFILNDNSPECIADSIVKALEHPRLEEISRAARASVEGRYTYEAATDRFRIILHSVVK